MSEKKYKLTEHEIKQLIKKEVEKIVFNEFKMPSDIFHDVRTMDTITIDEALIRPIPIENVIKHLIGTYNFSHFLRYNPQKHIGFIVTRELENETEVLLLYLKTDEAVKECEKVMNNLGWIMSANDLMAARYPELIGCQFEKKKDFEATERVFQTKYIYHFCPNNSSIIAKIKKNGLIPTMKSWKQFGNRGRKEIENIRKPINDQQDYSRIYFFLTYPKEDFDVKKYFQDKNVETEEYFLLKIDTKKLSTDMRFYYDPRQKDSVYTQNNIPPDAIVNL